MFFILGESMKKLFLLCALSFFLFINCKNQNTNNVQLPKEVGLKELICGGKSVLEKLNSKLFYDFDQDFGGTKKYSVELIAKPINAEIVNVSVMVDSVKAQGDVPNYICNLMDDVNTIIIILTSKEDLSIKKEYKIKISKSPSNVPDLQSSKLKEIKVDDNDILSKFEKYVCELSDVAQTKNVISLYVLPHNEKATVNVKSSNGSVSLKPEKTYNITLDYGINTIHVLVKSELEGELLYRIIVYREQDLGLKSFKVEGQEYCDKNTGFLTTDTLKILTEKVKVDVLAKNDNTTLTLKYNGKEIKTKEGLYDFNLDIGKNSLEVMVSDKDYLRSKVYVMFFVRTSSTSSGLIKLAVDGEDLIHLLSTANSITLPARHNEKALLKLEVLATSDILIKVKLKDSDVNTTAGIYNINLKEGNNDIVVSLYKDSTISESYSIFVRQHTKPDEPKAPEADEVEVDFVLSDGVNGSYVDGSYINISKTQTPDVTKRILVKNGKAKVNLKKNTFYNFNVEGRNDEYSAKKYAASSVISYYIGDKRKIVPIVQRPMQRVSKKAQAPSVDNLKFGTEIVTAGNIITSDVMKEISMSVTTVAPIEKLRFSTPLPMLAIGFVPSTSEDESSNVISATMVQDSTKHGDKWKSIWAWKSDASLTNEEDIVIVAYDVASNRLEYHLRIKPSVIATVAKEDDNISITNMSLKFERLPTQSHIYSVGQDEGAKNSSHYTSNISFEAKKGDEVLNLNGFDLYRKCVEDEGEFELIKRVVYKTPKSQTHKVFDSDGCLEDEKTYQYKVVAYTIDNKKNSFAKSEVLSVKVPKSTTLLLEYPVDRVITPIEAKNLNYEFRFSNPEILKDAIEVRLGFLISDRTGKVFHGSKFKYVFSDVNGKPEIYFAKSGDAIVTGTGYYGTRYSIKASEFANIDDLMSVDRERGIIKIKKDFFNLTDINMINKNVLKYEKGATYYWDVLDYGLKESTDIDDKPCKIIHKPFKNVTITSSVNDDNNGNNAWNGRAEFSLGLN